jgi:hypothetical protein
MLTFCAIRVQLNPLFTVLTLIRPQLPTPFLNNLFHGESSHFAPGLHQFIGHDIPIGVHSGADMRVTHQSGRTEA